MAEWSALQRDVHHLQERVAVLSTKQSTTAGAALLVRINELEAALEQLQKSNRRELGKLWKLLAMQDDAPRAAPVPNGHDEIDPELAAEIALQSAPPPPRS